MGCRFGVQLRNRDACSKVPLAAQSRSVGSVCRVGPGSAHGCKSLWCERHCGRAIPGWCVCLPLAPAGGWRTNQRPPRPGEPLFERLSHRGGGAPVAHGLPQSRRFTLARTTPLRSPGSTPSTCLLLPKMQLDQRRGLAFLKVAVHGIPDLAVQLLQAVWLRVNGAADGAGQACGNPP